MAKNPKSVNDASNLPAPSQPFPRWLSGTVTGMWALGVQSLPEPYDKILAVLSPGVGYIAGHGAQFGLSGLKNFLSEIEAKKKIKRIDQSIKNLDSICSSTNDPDEISMIKSLILEAKKSRLKIISDNIYC
ncbi:hypothetical protein [Gluconobacter albidus]|uniref:hypothetical protein n=1 Tax=Gluconobacter albidus TaxID=318683 RepID=UPI001B8D4097|nr:hypothetical protein [Gluconobacter albidus]MBS1029424.1 hypothetical protein [Gluconobacter albidus]